MSAMLASIPDEMALKVAEDVRDFGHGYLRVDARGRVTHVPSYLVLDPPVSEPRGERRMHE